MGRRIGWFDTESPRERKKREEKYLSDMFPLGSGQKERELALLREVVPSMRPEDALYHLLVVKELFMDGGEEGQSQAVNEWRATPLARKMSNEEQDRIVALAKLILACTSLEDMPSAMAVLPADENSM